MLLPQLAAPPLLPHAVPIIAFSGGGNIFWWQAGAAAWLESRFELASWLAAGVRKFGFVAQDTCAAHCGGQDHVK